MRKELFDKRNSLLFWFPKIKNLGIPVPATKWVEFPGRLGREMLEEENDKAVEEFQQYLQKITVVAKKIGYPVFIRTDMASYKHGWKKAAFVRNESDLFPHILETLEHNELVGMLGLNYGALVIREFLELDWRFKAFHGETPIAKERRYFIKDGEVLCHHPYWTKEAIQQAHKHDGTRTILGYFIHKLPNKWELMLEKLNTETKEEVDLLTEYSVRVSKILKGFWSVDFACGRDGTWFLIDMALGQASYHEKDCPIAEQLKNQHPTTES